MDDQNAPAPLPPATVDALVERLASGDGAAVADLMPVVYDELRRLARSYVRRERAQSVQATELVHEAYLRLAGDRPQRWQGRTHFLAIAAIGMRRLLVERARARGAEKRGGGRVQVTLDDALVAGPGPPSTCSRSTRRCRPSRPSTPARPASSSCGSSAG